MTLILPERDDAPSSPEMIHAFVADHVRDLHTIAAISRVEDRLHDRLRILREREQPCDRIRDALVLCADRRRELSAISAQPQAAVPATPQGNQ